MPQDQTPIPLPGSDTAKPSLLTKAYAGLAPVARRLATLDQALALLAEGGDTATEDAARGLRAEVRRVAPSVTMIGQVKAGKTTLVNAMIGRPDLLPADINPWTSVVTSIHMSPRQRRDGEEAKFRFFTEREWSHLLERGGRVGELAHRAGADQELEKVRQQLSDMRAKSRRRLGQKFEMLLGQEHRYGRVDADLVNRYVCLGDEGEDGAGRFADITRSADLYLHQPDLPLPLTIRDTPGVNDTFMVREQITVNAIRASQLCVVVLSAHQALSSVDMALIRIISTLPSRQVILFVNRVDELTDPTREIPEIRASLQATLKAQNGPTDAQIIFGSALWASAGLQGNLEDLNKASVDTLLNLAESEVRRGLAEANVDAMVWALSGIPALGQAIAMRVAEGEGATELARLTRAARNEAQGLAITTRVANRATGATAPVNPNEIAQRFDAVALRVETGLAQQLDKLGIALEDRLTSARRTFLGRATSMLISHLDTYGEDEVWSYDPAGLRMLLRTGYQVFASKARRAAQAALDDTATELTDLMRQSFDLPEACFELDPVTAPEPHPPVLLGQTIALDMKGSWWSRWWRRRRSFEAYAEEFSALIDAEIEPIGRALVEEYAKPYRAAVMDDLRAFLLSQRTRAMAMAGLSDRERARLKADAQADDSERRAKVAKALSILSQLVPDAPRKAAE